MSNQADRMDHSFLGSIAGYLYGKYGNDISGCSMVFPSRRAGLFFTHYLSLIIERPIWLPQVMSLSELMQSCSGLQPADPITLNFELYTVYKRVTGSNESFDQFYQWGEIILSDFDEIDKYMADARSLFTNASDLRQTGEQFEYMDEEQVAAIRGFWKTFRPGQHSLHQREFLRTWEALSEIYDDFKKHLAKKSLAYDGMLFREVASKILAGESDELIKPGLCIAGFNALSKCEKVLFDHLRDTGKAEFFWDYDDYYTMNERHQAGMFIRDNIKRYPHTGFVRKTSNLSVNPPVVEIASVPSNTGQSRLPGLFDQVHSGNDPANTAVVLPDEGLLLPVLSSLPEEAGEVNVTMGYPLKFHSLYGFMLNLMSLQSNLRRDDKGTWLFHHKDVTGLLEHPAYAPQSQDTKRRIRKLMAENNLVWVEAGMLKGLPGSDLIFKKAPEDTGFFDYLVSVLFRVTDQTQVHRENVANDRENDSSVGECINGFPEREFVFRIYTSILRLRDIVKSSGAGVSLKTIIRLTRKVLSGVRVPFSGEPLGGMQVMGVLETRALDFRNLVWLSMNEGVFPATGRSNSFVPSSLRRGYGLPQPEQQEAVYAYYFYRLMQRAEKVTLVYNSRSQGLFTGEMSRFLLQLKFDRNFAVHERNLPLELLPQAESAIKIEKTGGILKILERFYSGGGSYLSAAALNAFADCPLRFYFRYIARLPEPDEVREEVDMADFGNILHRASQLLYEPFSGREVTANDLRVLSGESGVIKDCVERAFFEIIPRQSAPEDEPEGMDSIVCEVIITYINAMLERDIKVAPFTIEGLEKKFITGIDVQSGAGVINVNLGGIIDRIDSVAGVARVVDYKTGGDDNTFSSLGSLFKRGDPVRKRAVFQTFFYAWLYSSSVGTSRAVTPVIYQVKRYFGNEPFMIFERPNRSSGKAVIDFSLYRELFEEYLSGMLADLFNPLVPFQQAEDSGICRYCTYRKICNR